MSSITRLPIKYALVIFCTLSASAAMPQDRVQAPIDSLQKILSTVQHGESLQRAITLDSLGRLYMIRSDYVHSTACFTECLTLAEKFNDEDMVAGSYRNMSIVYFYQHDYAKSLGADHKALAIEERKHQTAQMAVTFKSLGDTYLEMGDSNRASEYYDKALPNFIAQHDLQGMAALYANQSILTHGDYQRAIELRLKAKAIWDKNPPNNILPTINVGNIGVAYLDLVRYKAISGVPASSTVPHDTTRLLQIAGNYLKTAIHMSHANGDVEDSSYFTGVLAELEEHKGDFRNAYYHFRKYQDITDSIFSQENKNKIAEIENTRAIELKNKEIQNKELQIANQHKKMWLLASCIAFLIMSGALLYRQTRIRKRNNATLRRLNTELDEANKVKARFFGILGHDLRSPVANLINFLQLQEMQPGALSPEESAERLVTIRSSAQSLLETMENMLLWSKGQMEHFRPEPTTIKVNELFDYLQKRCPPGGSITYHFQNPEELTIHTDIHYLQTILYNLTVNAAKVLANTPSARIEWKAYKQEGKTCLSITDNGPGIRPEQLAALYDENISPGVRQGLGLHIIRDLAKAIGCQILAQPNPDGGMQFILYFT